MERKKSFQMKQRFDRCKTPMGSVPISVIMGFDYPLEGSSSERGGRGETAAAASSSYGYNSSYSKYGGRGGSVAPFQSLNTNYMNVNMLERMPRQPSSSPSWPSSLMSSRSRAVTEVREVAGSSTNNNGFTSSFALEHPKQQPCRYATALSMTAMSSTTPRSARSSTVMPSSTTSSWRNTSCSQSRSSDTH